MKKRILSIALRIRLVDGFLFIGKKLLINCVVSYLLLYTTLVYSNASDRVLNDVNQFLFDDKLLKGFGSTVQTLNTFTSVNPLLPDEYSVDIFVNNIYVGQQAIPFQKIDDKVVTPCFSSDLVSRFEIYPQYLKEVDKELTCLQLKDFVNNSSVHFDSARFHLQIFIPQAYLKQYPRDYISPETWQKGNTMGFVNYQWSNYYHSKSNDYSAYLRLQSGLNWDLWRLRHTSIYQHDKLNTLQWSNEQLTLTRVLPSIHSELTLWENQTSGMFFPSIFYRGAQLVYDERMLTGRLQGYAPTVRGVAATNARVIVKQGGQTVYDNIVPAGPFEINDIYPNAANGDLHVSVIETDQRVSQFVVPFSALPNSLREKQFRYTVTLGEMKPFNQQNHFLDFAFQYGINNFVTVNTAGQLASNYYGLQLGNVYNMGIGALGLNIIYKNAKFTAAEYQSWSAKLAYNRNLPELGINFSLTGSHYFSLNNIELMDVVREKNSRSHHRTGKYYYSHLRNRMDVSLTKSLDGFGSLVFSGTVDRYAKGKKTNRQLNFTYNNSWNSILYGITLSRAMVNKKKENTLLFTFAIPINQKNYSAIYRQNIINRTDNGLGTQVSFSGIADKQKTVSYSLNANKLNKYQNTGIGGTLQKKFPYTHMNASFSYYNHSYSSSFGTQGSVVFHGGGVTLGPYLGNAFAVIEAKGASGVQVINNQGIYLNKKGYAVIPSLTPYRKNDIILDADVKDNLIDIVESKTYVTPYAGASLLVKFKTEMGYPLLINLSYPSLPEIPLGANVYNENNQKVAIIGQGNQLYFRTDKPKGTLTVKWGESSYSQCRFTYQLSTITPNKPIYLLNELCESFE